MAASLLHALRTAHQALTNSGVDHALIGGLALGSHGIHRATLDVDLLVDGAMRLAAVSALRLAGFEILAESPEAMQLNGPGPLDLLLANRPASRAMLQRALPDARLGLKCVVAEDLIGLKIQAFCNEPRRALQDQADIASLIVSKTGLDWEKIKEYADLFGIWPVIADLRKKYEP
jgi:hypothetical protein